MKFRPVYHVIALLAGLVRLVLSPPEPYTAQVVSVHDGDTLTVAAPSESGAVPQPVTVRLYGVDAPELRQPYGRVAAAAATEWALGQTVTVRPVAVDLYGRTVARVDLPDGRSLGEALVRGGYAWWYIEYARSESVLEAAQGEARSARRGLWAADQPIPPWTWRTARKKKATGPDQD